jgi:hypothetical protein
LTKLLCKINLKPRHLPRFRIKMTIETELRKAFQKIKKDLDTGVNVSASDVKKAETWAILLKEKPIEKNNTRNQ